MKSMIHKFKILIHLTSSNIKQIGSVKDSDMKMKTQTLDLEKYMQTTYLIKKSTTLSSQRTLTTSQIKKSNLITDKRHEVTFH